MIEIAIKAEGITIQGHANFAPEGYDIVCAAVSTLAQVFVASMEELSANEIKAEMRAGDAVIRYNKNLTERGKLLLDSFILGLSMIAETYPHNVRVVQALTT